VAVQFNFAADEDGDWDDVGQCRLSRWKPMLRVPGTNLLTLTHDEPLSTFVFKLDLRRYKEDDDEDEAEDGDEAGAGMKAYFQTTPTPPLTGDHEVPTTTSMAGRCELQPLLNTPSTLITRGAGRKPGVSL
jgi:hypothetical protein